MLNPGKWLEKYGDYLYSLAMLKTGKKEVSEDLGAGYLRFCLWSH
jgi:hypothetical protein